MKSKLKSKVWGFLVASAGIMIIPMLSIGNVQAGEDPDDAASENCVAMGGQLEQYKLGRDIVGLCRIGKSAIGEWTLYNFDVQAVDAFVKHPAYREVEPEKFIITPPKVGEGGNLPEGPSFIPSPEGPNGKAAHMIQIFNPAVTYCSQLGGKTYYLKPLIPSSNSRDEGVCLFPDSSAIEIWTLFHGPWDRNLPEETRNLELTKILTGK